MNSETARSPNHQGRIRVAIEQASVCAYELKNSLFLVKTSDKEDGLCFADVFSRVKQLRIDAVKDNLGLCRQARRAICECPTQERAADSDPVQLRRQRFKQGCCPVAQMVVLKVQPDCPLIPHPA